MISTLFSLPVADLNMFATVTDNAEIEYYSMMNWLMIDFVNFLEMVVISNLMTVAEVT